MAASLPLLAPSSQPNRFFTLPPEIRVSVYKFVFLDSWVHIEMERKLGDAWWSWRDIRRIPRCARYQILLTCQRCYGEARGIWYSSTVWDFDSMTVRPFLDAGNMRPYLACIKYVQLLDAHDLTQLSPRLLPSLRYVVVANQIPLRWKNSKSVQDMDNEETFRALKKYLFKFTRICDYLYHDGADQKLPRERSFCVHFCLDIECYSPKNWSVDLSEPYTHTYWRFLVDLDANTVEKRMIGTSPSWSAGRPNLVHYYGCHLGRLALSLGENRLAVRATAHSEAS